MRKLIAIGALLLVGCQRRVEVSSPTPSAGSAAGAVGAATPGDALAAFMAAAKAEDLQAIGAVWGDPNGLARDKMSRSELEMRTYIMVKCVRNDRYVAGSESIAASDRRMINVQITKGAITRGSNFTFARSRQGRWFVEKFEMEPLTPICQLS